MFINVICQYKLFFFGSPVGCLLVGRLERATLLFSGIQRTESVGDNDEGEKSGGRLPFGEAAICPRFRNGSGKGGRGDLSHRTIEVCSQFLQKHGQTSIELELGLKFLVSSSVFSVQFSDTNFPYFTWIFSDFQKEQRFSNKLLPFQSVCFTPLFYNVFIFFISKFIPLL